MSSWLFLLTAFVFTYGPVANALPANASLPGNASHAANPSKAMDVCAQDPFFKVTRENLEESKALEWFADWDAKVDRESAPYKKSASYYDYFIQQHVSPPDAASCTIKECTELQCGDFVGAMGDRQKARRAYFISLCVMNMWKVANEMHDQANELSGIMALHTQEIAETFIWQVNPDDEKKCKLLAGLVKTGISAAFAGIAVIPVVGPATTAAAKAGQKFFEISAGVSASATSFVGGEEIDQGLCKEFPQPGPHLWPKIQAKMERILDDSIQNLRRLLETDFNGIIMGNLTMNGTSNVTSRRSRLAEEVLSGKYFILSPEVLDLLQNTYKITKEMRKLYVEKAIATCLRLGQCSIHCVDETVHPRGAEEDIASSRFEPRPGIWCQYQCWRDSTHTKNIELFGLKALQEAAFVEVTLEDLGRHSYDDWEANRYHAPNVTDFSVESFNGVPDDKSQITSGDHLPVCFSEMAPHNFHRGNNSDKVLSCFCGDRYGNETAAFFRAIHIEEWDGFKHKGLHNACDTSYKKDQTWPLATFMGYCRLAEAGLARDGERSHEEGGQELNPDPRCDRFTKEVKELTEVRNHDNAEATREMCEVSRLGEDIRWYTGQQDSSAKPEDRYDFDKACRAFLQQ